MQVGIAHATQLPAELSWRRNGPQRDPSAPDVCELDEYGDVIATAEQARRRIVGSRQQLVQQPGGEARSGVGARATSSACPTSCGDGGPIRTITKVAAHRAAGAREVVRVELSGLIRLFGPAGEHGASALGLNLQLPADTYPPHRYRLKADRRPRGG